MTAPLPRSPKLVRVGLELAAMQARLGRLPKVAEIMEHFRCHEATAYRYLAAMRGTRIGLRMPAAGAAPKRRRRRRRAATAAVEAAALPPAPPSSDEAKLMDEFGFSREVAASVLAYERGEGAPQ